MCGIVAAAAGSNIVPVLIEGLKKLEYRGYDSAGIAVINGKLQRLRALGRVVELEKLTVTETLTGQIGIAHTRWATHGIPSERNAHPHVSGNPAGTLNGMVSVVHNGIIENYEQLKAELQGKGYVFTSDTDTEVIAHLVHSHLQADASLFAAVRHSIARLKGAFAIAVVSDASPSRLVVARHGAPLGAAEQRQPDHYEGGGGRFGGRVISVRRRGSSPAPCGPCRPTRRRGSRGARVR